MAAVAILNLLGLLLPILVTWSISCNGWLHSCKITSV